MQALVKDWHLAIVVLGITGAGLLMAILGWSIPELRVVPSLQQDGEQQIGRNVRLSQLILCYLKLINIS